MKSVVFVFTLACLSVLQIHAVEGRAEAATGNEVKLAGVFRDNAVLQRNIDLPVWGTAPVDSTVTVIFENQCKTTVANKDGAWRVKLEPLKAVKLDSVNAVPQGKTLQVVAQHGGQTASITLRNLVVGDVWLCAGQSNIAGKLKGGGEYQGQKADYPGLRHFTPADDAAWLVCSPQTARDFKKVAFYFGRRVHNESLVPIGLIVSAVGGSNIESWLNQKPYETGKNYQTLIEPITGFGIRGMVWYQGESNAMSSDEHYGTLLTSLIKGWREAWGQGDFPVYFVQLPGFGERKNELGERNDGWPRLRQHQLETLAIPNTGMAVTIDIGDKSVHPPNKFDTGERLARLALFHAYGFQQQQLPTGPLYRSHQIDGPTVRIRFEYAAGLMVAEKEGINAPKPTPRRPIECLSLQDKQGKWHPAQGKVEGEELVITSQHVAEPVAARYAYFPHPAGPLLYNKDGLPASPFETP